MSAINLKFAGEAPIEPDPAWAADLRAVGASPANAKTLLELVARMLTTAEGIDVVEEIERAGAAVGMKPKAARSAVRSLYVVTRGAVAHGVSQAGLQEDLTKLGVDADASACVCAALEEFKPGLATHMRTRPVANSLIDLDWRLGVCVATDDVPRVGATYVQLSLTVDCTRTRAAGDADGRELRREVVEMTVPQFYALLSDLERAKSYVDYLSSAHV